MRIIDCSEEFINNHMDRFGELYGQVFRIVHPSKDYFSDVFYREQMEKKVNYISQSMGKVFCSVSDSGINGFIHVYLQPFLDEKRLIVADFVVDENCRRQGVGTALIQCAEEYAKAEACDTVCLMAANTENALTFYRTSGYSDFRVEMVKKFK